jgi:hypothetical protein
MALLKSIFVNLATVIGSLKKKFIQENEQMMENHKSIEFIKIKVGKAIIW